MTVRILEDTVVDRIAAGEVVERPASVLKELMENALDAGGTRLEIELKSGGVGLVSVTDDGEGMSRADAMLAIERHATSKIRSADDLVGVITHGFRGEALPSIASVSRFELRTRREEDEVGTRIRIDGGRMQGVDEVAAPRGTTVSVRSLFHHVPARRKFLRATQTELSHCLEAVRRATIRRPQVSVRVRHDGRDVLRAGQTEELSTRVRDLVGDEAQILVPVDETRGDVRVHGLISPMGTHRSSATGGIYLFVRDRFVRDPVLRRALTEAYRGVLPPGRYPIVVLNIVVDPARVDVNVHPAKTEVRFAHAAQVSRTVADVVREALRAGVRQAARPTRGEVPPREVELPLLQTPPVVVEPKPRVVPHPDDDPLLALRAPPPEPLELPPVEARAASAAVVAERPSVVAEPAPVVAEPAVVPRWRQFQPQMVLAEGLALVEREGVLSWLDVRGLQQRWVRSRLATGAASRPLLAPVVVEPSRADLQALIAGADALSELGVDVAAFGPGELALMAVPEVVSASDATALFQDLARALAAESDLLDVLAMHAVPGPADAHGLSVLLAAVDESLPALQPGAPLCRPVDAAAVRRWIAHG